MMKTIMKSILAVVILAGMASAPALAQHKYQLAGSNYSLKIEGTSNVHDWSMTAEDISGTAMVTFGDNGLEGFDKVNISVRSKKIESGKRIMNNKTYDALEADDHPTIHYELISVSNLESSGNQFSGKATGKLEIAGESNIVTIPFQGSIVNGNTFKVNGDFSLEMTDYGIDPPTAMLGTLKTGNQLTLNYEFTFNQ
jgi:polyisoprenoid-binding protein YceI